ncbi:MULTISPECIES: stage V sporulation protein AD [unclassified Paenibacillus]|uniref:stage V sporulation protein AD n=1 Tax=unclassified Paenibacillus TaxID=185978 RepID=UPI001AE154EE|nr:MULTISPECIES: stage V sporulation protein AD [unclassified Paenibacillus]MBP1156395.1 stage V sporulation protein AD [Paenibacillus sp. PvP091]MBP1168219.1 stage V sporulation protein AD [Paenibacillus sp. PvR098]MBP2439247.1 stage V sporulation protein AD [Paenibacillus sp. PvP052]
MLKGYQSWEFKKRPVIMGTATIVGPDEGNGPLGNEFDIVHADNILGQDSWEKAEKKMLEEAAKLAIENAGLTKEHIQFYIGGDLLNQIISNSFAVRTMQIPYIGIFGACSTSMEGLAIASMIVDSGYGHQVMAGTCSHNCTAEKQFRYPTEYGSQKPPTAQYTVTGAGCVVVGNRGKGPVVTGATIGRVIDMGIKDPFNMGAAMAPAAVDTLQAHFRDFKREPGYYDLILTGDLAKVGYEIACELLEKHQVPIKQTNYYDCGLMMYDLEKQNVQAGGSGCGCSATVTYGHIMKRIKKGELKRVLIVATGALLSPLSFQQGESIPCIAHAVAIESEVV